MTMLSVTKIMVKRRYSPIRGMTSDVEGMVSVMTSRNTVRESRTEIQRVTFSPQSDGRVYDGLTVTCGVTHQRIHIIQCPLSAECLVTLWPVAATGNSLKCTYPFIIILALHLLSDVAHSIHRILRVDRLAESSFTKKVEEESAIPEETPPSAPRSIWSEYERCWCFLRNFSRMFEQPGLRMKSALLVAVMW
ncbi:hypothetical protein EYF80_007855 [Liparis tanakae]|uniref:Uncharacterized protein n=1 Tax=Liparis tanakae TaxID=230148 RepID=A0A4Z2IW22_9TELE|nr:hypothetical protein EYF80_007855 [Liparis tanakae]